MDHGAPGPGAVVFTGLRTLKDYLLEQEPTGDTRLDVGDAPRHLAE